MQSNSRFLTPDQVAEMIGVSRRTVQRWMTRAIVPSLRIGGTRLIEASDLEAVITRAKGLPVAPEIG